MKYNAGFCSWLCIFAEVVRVLNNSNVSSHILLFTKLNQIPQFHTNCSKPSILKVIPTNNNLSDVSFVKCKNQNKTHLALRTFIQTICITLSIFSEGKLPPGKWKFLFKQSLIKIVLAGKMVVVLLMMQLNPHE